MDIYIIVSNTPVSSYRTTVAMNFLARSAKKFQQQAAQIISANPTPSTSVPLPIFHFPQDTEKFIVGSDADYRPASTSKVAFTAHVPGPAGDEGEGFTRFQGVTNGDGYAALRSKVPASSFYGTPTTDVSPYKFLTLRVRAYDSRRYFINLQTESYLETDLYQHRLFLTPPASTEAGGAWEDVTLKWNDFTLTNNGQIQETQVSMDKYRLKTIGISVLDRLPGKFKLDLLWIRAENGGGTGAARMDSVDAL